MRLIYITVTMPFGNVEQFFIPEVVELLRRGQEIMIVPRAPSGNIVNSDAKGLENVALSQPLLSLEIVWVAIGEIIRKPVKSLLALKILFRSRTFKILLKNLAIFPKGLWLSRIARKWGATHIHAHWATTTSTMALVANQISGIPWSFTAYRWDIIEKNLFEVKVQKASFVRFISESGVQMAREILKGEQLQGKIRVIHMGVPFASFQANQFAEYTPPVILCPAGLLPVKGHTYLLQAISILKNRGVNCILKIAGEGGLREELKRHVKELNLIGTVQFLGYVPHNELLGFYRDGKVGIVVLPSVDLENGNHEGIPVCLMEAMAYGIPVVSTNTGAIPELLEDGSGVMVEEKNAGALAEAIARLIKDAEYYTVIAERGRGKVSRDFNSESIAEALLRLFKAHAKQS